MVVEQDDALASAVREEPDAAAGSPLPMGRTAASLRLKTPPEPSTPPFVPSPIGLTGLPDTPVRRDGEAPQPGMAPGEDPAEGRRVPGAAPLNRWQAWALAVAMTIATLGLRFALDKQLGSQPALMIFALPIMLSAYMGGLSAGLLATGLSSLMASYFLLAPIGSFAVASSAECWNLSFVALAGAVISMLSEALHRARGRADIATRANRRATEALVAASSLHGAIVNSANFSIIATDTKGLIQSFSVGAEEMLGYRADEVLNRMTPVGFHDVSEVVARTAALSREFGAPILPGIETLIYKASRGIKDTYELTKVRKDGRRFPAELSVAPLRDPQDAVVGYLLIGADITVRKQAEAALRKNEAQLQTIVDNISEAVVVSDLDGRLLQFNRVALELLGYSDPDQGRRHITNLTDTFELAALDGTSWTVDQWPLARILRGEKLNNLECRMRRLGADWLRVFSFGGNLVFDASGRPLLAVVTFSDITERKLAVEVIHRLNSDLEQRVLDRTAQLVIANKELEAFSYSVSHDLRAPLRSLDGFSQALMEDCADRLGAEDQDNLRRIRSASQRMGQLIDDMLKLSHLTRAEMDRKTVDLSRMAEEIAEEMRAANPARVVRFEISEDLTAEADPRLLRIALTNLFANAWKFTARRAEALIEFGCCGDASIREFFVRDNGVGFDMAHAGKLFGAFQRLHAMNDFPGTGIGLVTVQRIVHRHGGLIRAESTAGAGATFSFTLPPAKTQQES